MKKYTKPELYVENLEINDIITVSGEDAASTLSTWGAQLKAVDANEVINPFE